MGREHRKKKQALKMGNLPSLWDENKVPPDHHGSKNQDSVSIKLSCADFGTFDRRSDHTGDEMYAISKDFM